MLRSANSGIRQIGRGHYLVTPSKDSLERLFVTVTASELRLFSISRHNWHCQHLYPRSEILYRDRLIGDKFTITTGLGGSFDSFELRFFRYHSFFTNWSWRPMNVGLTVSSKMPGDCKILIDFKDDSNWYHATKFDDTLLECGEMKFGPHPTEEEHARREHSGRYLTGSYGLDDFKHRQS